MLTLNQLLEFKDKTNGRRLSVKKATNADSSVDYEISGVMPVKIDIKDNININGIEFNLKDLLRKYAKAQHGSRNIVIRKIEFPKDSYTKDYKLFKRNGFQIFTKDKNFVPDPDFVEIDRDHITFNVLYSYQRHNKKWSDEHDKWKDGKRKMIKDFKNKKEK